MTGFVDNQQVFTWTDTAPYLSGRVDLASGFYFTDFDNLSIEQLPGYQPYYGEYLDNLEMNDLADPPATKLVYTGSWKHANGGGMYQYQRSSSISQSAGATVKPTRSSARGSTSWGPTTAAPSSTSTSTAGSWR